MTGNGASGDVEPFEANRRHLAAVAYRMLGSLDEADDAVQEAWLRYQRTDTSDVENLAGWLTTVVGRVCLNLLRSRRRRAEDLVGVHMPDPLVEAVPPGPETVALTADTVGLALMVVLDALSPDERVAFVLHDMFSVPFDEIAELIGKAPAATRQLASRARRRVRGQAPVPDRDVSRQRKAVEAFFAAAQDGDLTGLMTVLHPDVVLRSDGGRALQQVSGVLDGADEVAAGAVTYGRLSPYVRPALVNGAAGVVVIREGRPLSVMAFCVIEDRIVAIDVLADPDRLARLGLVAAL